MEEIKINDYYNKLRGNGQCKCKICGCISWTNMSYRITDDKSALKDCVVCGQCLFNIYPKNK